MSQELSFIVQSSLILFGFFIGVGGIRDLLSSSKPKKFVWMVTDMFLGFFIIMTTLSWALDGL